MVCHITVLIFIVLFLGHFQDSQETLRVMPLLYFKVILYRFNNWTEKHFKRTQNIIKLQCYTVFIKHLNVDLRDEGMSGEETQIRAVWSSGVARGGGPGGPWPPPNFV